MQVVNAGESGGQTENQRRRLSPALAARLELERKKAGREMRESQQVRRLSVFPPDVVGWGEENMPPKDGQLLGLTGVALQRARNESAEQARPKALALLKKEADKGRLTLDYVLDEPVLLQQLLSHATRLSCAEAVQFWCRAKDFAELRSPAQQLAMAINMWANFLSSKAAKQVLLSEAASADIRNAINCQAVNGGTFRAAQSEVHHMIQTALYPAFIASMKH
jgi:hypothetical protein